MPTEVLSKFQEFLINKERVPAKYVPFYARWVSKFIAFCNNCEKLPSLGEFEDFLKQLESENVAEWQINQAETAVKLYIENFGKDSNLVLSVEDSLNNNQFVRDVINKMREAIRLKHYSYSTERSYLNWAQWFFKYLQSIKNRNISAQAVYSSDITDYLTYLAVKKNVSSSTQNQAFNALVFLFRGVLKIEVGDLCKAVRAKRGPKLPVVLTVEEIKRIFECVQREDALIIQLLYGSGMRLMELVRLRVKDVEIDDSLIFVRSSKGDKDRRTILPEIIKAPLQKHLEKVKALHNKDADAGYGEVYLPAALSRKYPGAAKEWGWQYVFPAGRLSGDPRSGKIRRHHISPSAIQKIIRRAVQTAGIVKPATVHTLRHSFATHLLMNGVNIREIQQLLGHKNIETTSVYTHVLRDMSNTPRSPLDSLYESNGS